MEGLKKPEIDLINEVLKEFPKDRRINVKEFADKVKMQLLPLERKDADTQIDEYTSRRGEHHGQRYEGITLPPELRGNVADYSEQIYESPIKTSAGEIHFDTENIENYFAHPRVEDMAFGESGRAGLSYAEDMLKTAKDNLEWAKSKGTEQDIEKYSKEVKEFEKEVDNESKQREARTITTRRTRATA